MDAPKLSNLNQEETNQTEVLSGNEDNSKEPGSLKSYLKSLDISAPSSNIFDSDQEDDDDLDLPNYPHQSYSKISEEQDTDNFMGEFNSFYNEMIGKVRTLRNTPALMNQNLFNLSNLDEQKLLKNLKDTPEIQKRLAVIKEMDNEIKNVMRLYDTEKRERLETQLEMCKELHQSNSLPEKDTRMFLDMCDFELTECGEEEEREDEKSAGDGRKAETSTGNNFVWRNVELAKEGFLARCSLTDEDKIRLENLLCEVDEDVTESHQNNVESFGSNAYIFTNDVKKRMEDLDSDLEKFSQDERANEKGNISGDSLEKLNDCLLKVKLDKIDSELENLRSIETEERIKCSSSSSVMQENSDHVS